MIENEKDFSCSQQHNLPIISILLNPNKSREWRFLCQQCLAYGEYNGQVLGLHKTIELIQQQQKEKFKLVQGIINHPIKTIQELFEQVQKLKSKVFEQFEELINLINDWIFVLQEKEAIYSKFSFYKELENLLGNPKEKIQQLEQEIQIVNYCYNYKVFNKIKYFTQFQEYESCFQQLKILEYDNQQSNQDLQNLEQQILKQSKIKLKQNIQIQEGEINFNLIDQSVEQNIGCDAIDFNSSGTIMISNQGENIKVWSFNKGFINPITTLIGHSDWIYCLIFSKKQDSFFSGSGDNTIRCWKKINQNDWICSQPYQNHTDMVMCIIINSKEDQLFSGSSDNTIIIWMVDLNKNKLTYFYQLKKHNAKVIALSLNQSENFLVSCAVDKDSIILWERNQNNQFEFKYVVIIAKILKILSNNKKLNSYLLTNSSINSQFKQKDQNLSLQEIHSLYGQQGVRNQIKYGCLNQRKEFFKKKSKKLLIQAEIIKLLMNFFFQQFTINRGICYSQDIKQSYM